MPRHDTPRPASLTAADLAHVAREADNPTNPAKRRIDDAAPMLATLERLKAGGWRIPRSVRRAAIEIAGREAPQTEHQTMATLFFAAALLG